MVKRSKAVKILRVTYLRLMRLKFCYSLALAMMDNIYLQLECPDLSYCLNWSFVTDAYITIDAVCSHGSQSLRLLCEGDKELSDAFDEVIARRNKLIPDFRDIRNDMFAHFNMPQDQSASILLFGTFDDIIRSLLSLHNYCCIRYGVSDSEINGYDARVFERFDDQIHTFVKFVSTGYLKVKGDNCLQNRLSGMSPGHKSQ